MVHQPSYRSFGWVIVVASLVLAGCGDQPRSSAASNSTPTVSTTKRLGHHCRGKPVRGSHLRSGSQRGNAGLGGTECHSKLD
jgi:hypothetical protein